MLKRMPEQIIEFGDIEIKNMIMEEEIKVVFEGNSYSIKEIDKFEYETLQINDEDDNNMVSVNIQKVKDFGARLIYKE
jgi:hypothetical protein